MIKSGAQTHGIRCGVYPEQFCTYINVVRERRRELWVVIFEGVEVDNPRHSVQNVLPEGLIEWKGSQTGYCVSRRCKHLSSDRGTRVGDDGRSKSTGPEEQNESEKHGSESSRKEILYKWELGRAFLCSSILNDGGNGIWTVEQDSLLPG